MLEKCRKQKPQLLRFQIETRTLMEVWLTLQLNSGKEPCCTLPVEKCPEKLNESKLKNKILICWVEQRSGRVGSREPWPPLLSKSTVKERERTSKKDRKMSSLERNKGNLKLQAYQVLIFSC